MGARMSAVPAEVAEWLAGGNTGVLARVVGSGGSTPRELGATMLVGADGTIVGSLSAGCLESGVVERARELMAADRPRWRVDELGTGADPVFDPGIACGGSMHVLLQVVDEGDLAALTRAFGDWAAGRRCLLATRTVPGGQCRVLAVAEHGEPVGSLGSAVLDAELCASRAQLFASADLPVRRWPVDPATFLQIPPLRPRVVIVGADEFAAALCRSASAAGMHVAVVDPRGAFATTERFPDADVVAAMWPERYIASVADDLGPADAVCVLTHDQRVDVPALVAALDAGAGYVGALGSRATHADRLVRLELAGVEVDAAAGLHSPIGLDIGATTPAETAIAIVAEIVAVRSGRSAVPLCRTEGPIRAAATTPRCEVT